MNMNAGAAGAPHAPLGQAWLGCGWHAAGATHSPTAGALTSGLQWNGDDGDGAGLMVSRHHAHHRAIGELAPHYGRARGVIGAAKSLHVAQVESKWRLSLMQ